MSRIFLVFLLTFVLLVTSADSGKALPEFSFNRFSTGKAEKIQSYEGKPLVINFWADWCPPCKRELPDFQKSYTAHNGDFEMVGIALSNSNNPKAYISKNKFSWVFGADIKDKAKKACKVKAVPTTIFVDKDGNVVARFEGLMEAKEFEAALKKIIE